VGANTKGGNGGMATHGFSYSEAFDPVKSNGTQWTAIFSRTKRGTRVSKMKH